MRGLNSKSLIQPSETLPVELTGIHSINHLRMQKTIFTQDFPLFRRGQLQPNFVYKKKKKEKKKEIKLN